MKIDVQIGNFGRVSLVAVLLCVLSMLILMIGEGGIAFGLILVLMLPCALVFAYFAYKSPRVRLYAFIGVGMFVMQSESGWTSSFKPIYFIMVVVFSCLSISHAKHLRPEIRRAFRPLFFGSGVLAIIIIAYIIYSLIQGEAPSRVVRDAFTYVLIAAAPVIGADASRVSTLKSARLFIAGATGLAAVSFSVFWLSARQVGVLGVDRILMYSIILSGLGILVGVIYGLLKLNPAWLIFGAFCLLSILVTGTRSGLLLILGIFGAIGARYKLRIPVPRLLAGMLAVTAVTYASLPAISKRLTRDGFMEGRMQALVNVFEEGVEADASGQMRQKAYEILFEIWRDRPLFGVGFGRAYESVRPGEAPVDFQLDSGMLLFAKFGLVGAAGLVLAIAIILFGLVSFHNKTHVRSEAKTIARAFILMVACFFLLGVPMEDKGFAYSICLLVYLLGVHNRTLLTRANVPPPELPIRVSSDRGFSPRWRAGS